MISFSSVYAHYPTFIAFPTLCFLKLDIPFVRIPFGEYQITKSSSLQSDRQNVSEAENIKASLTLVIFIQRISRRTLIAVQFQCPFLTVIISHLVCFTCFSNTNNKCQKPY